MDQIVQSTAHGKHNPSHVLCYTPSVIEQNPTAVVLQLKQTFRWQKETKEIAIFQQLDTECEGFGAP